MSTNARPRVTVSVVRADGGVESVLPMVGDRLLCGRSGDLQLPDDPFVGETQMHLFFSQGRLAVEDVGGGNGIYTRLRAEHQLEDGSDIRVGRQRLVLELVPSMKPGMDGATAWGSPDAGYPFRLVQIFEGGAYGSAFALKEGDNLLGRAQGDITFPSDGFVSSRHAMLHVSWMRVTIKDVGSSNGTFLRLTQVNFVEDGDEFLLGRQLVKISVL